MDVEESTDRYKLGSLELVGLGKVGYFGIRLAGGEKWFIILAPAPENHWFRVPPNFAINPDADVSARTTDGVGWWKDDSSSRHILGSDRGSP
ncbi:hypothetical protein N7452_005833 [Penicillium brevicompactum]|uniref:Uncharacterized protein n=1 Tax=Penicillium brevicompactum TaxID=5074 RepID=A0A9W9QJI4_PENBR|nr:hypothetical protein N7452_005833 [Penicillium brevicompactum]